MFYLFLLALSTHVPRPELRRSLCAAASSKSALANFSELDICVGFQFYISVILGNNSVQYSKFPVSSLFFLENIALGKLFVYCVRLYCPLKVAPIILTGFLGDVCLFGVWVFLRLLAQLHETETAFDEFWIKHQQKLEQCLRLRNFEQNFREVRTSGWRSIFGNAEMMQKKILPPLVFFSS